MALATVTEARADPATAPPPAALSCGTGGIAALYIPRDRGFLGRLALDDEVLTLRAAPLPSGAAPAELTRGYVASVGGRDYLNPTLVLAPGQRVRVDLVNGIDEPTIVHWHGFAVDTRNDGGGTVLAAPGERYAYDFTLRNRGGLYWYHPHPHGLTAGQAYRGMFGMVEIGDGDEERLRRALDLVPGTTELPLVLQDRRAGSDYAPSEADRMHGFLGDRVLLNGTACPQLDVATRIYRFRVLNASNARTYRLGFRDADGKPFAFTLIGNDGGLLPAPRSCTDCLISTAERLDILLDLAELGAGDTLTLETLAFDPMHMEMAPAPRGEGGAVDHSAMGHGAAPGATGSGAPVDHAAMGHGAGDAHAEHLAHGGAFPEGSRRALLVLRVREKTRYGGRIPARLSSVPAIDVAGATERPFRLGFAKGRWRINDRVFAMGETPIEVKRNTVEVWLIRNYFNSMPHAMHLHGFGFEVLERQTSPDAIAALRVDDRGRLATDGGRKDTVLVWPGESVRIAIDFACPFPGDQTYMFHCHNLEHEDGGMMLGVKVS
ncbi:MAG TPA: multicopper oxidase domain-containing protein [Casimicrobiaceae bacterium]|nr:multicopper oxidase domain-containing protein [Casimicrobiaceae bacterium]